MTFALPVLRAPYTRSSLQREAKSHKDRIPSQGKLQNQIIIQVNCAVSICPPDPQEQKMMEEPVSETASTSFSSDDNRGRTVEECEDMIQRSLKTPTVKFLKEHLEKAGCTFGDNFIRAIHCDKKFSGGYVRGEGIVICRNHMEIQDEVNQVVIHELIHAYDDCRAANLDWANCAHHACSEIRAGHLSGDCHYKRELLRGYIKVRGHEQECIRRRVMKSLHANPYCSETAAKDAMEAVWDVCYNDTKPFDRAP